ncbi:Pentatricopeptide repeat [Dillenia turbinata]|uniref:Pentatricopeptide repeat n=1 Tax=Dillenia turbinata TaxID=194707 RepID=A0AAN8UEB7_9MAGN
MRFYIVFVNSFISLGDMDRAHEVVLCLVRSFSEIQRLGRVLEVYRWLIVMSDRVFVLDNATCALVIGVFFEKSFVSRVLGHFDKIVELGFAPNSINYTSLIDGLCKKGSIKQAFEVLEEMVKKGWKPNVYTETTLIVGLCKKGWTERAFRLFLELVGSENY